MRNSKMLIQRIRQSVTNWAQTEYDVPEVVLGLVEPDEDENDRWLVDFAFPTIPYWQGA